MLREKERMFSMFDYMSAPIPDEIFIAAFVKREDFVFIAAAGFLGVGRTLRLAK